MSKPIIGIVGASGSGKSTSLRNLPTEKTHIIDLERKGLPFPNASDFNITSCANVKDFDTALDTALKDDKCEVIVIESFTKYVEVLIALAQSSFKGFDVWSYYNRSIRLMLDKVKNDRAIVIFTAIDEIVHIAQPSGDTYNVRRIKVQGKQHEGCIEKEFLMVLFTEAKRGKDGKVEYVFQTNSDGITSAKTPMSMFDELYIPNDINDVISAAKKYYK
jgi:ABC-type dipeptide/oligopeptide/nickel transport system ATPase component